MSKSRYPTLSANYFFVRGADPNCSPVDVAQARRTAMTPDDHSPQPPGTQQTLNRFTHQLIGLARQRLYGLLRARVDPEDVVQSVYKSFLLRYGAEMLAQEDEF